MSSSRFDNSPPISVLQTKIWLSFLHKRMAIISGNDLSAKKERRRYKRRNGLTVNTWNVETLVESTGDERVCRESC